LSNIAHGSGSCADRLRNMLIERVIFRFDSVSDYSQNINDMLARLRPQLLKRREQYFADEAAILIAVIAEGIERGEFEGVNKEDAADALIVATNSLLPYSLSTKELGGREEILVRVQKVADLLLSGLKARR
jgi:hypothetical protein